MPKHQALSPRAVEEILMKHAGLVREERTRPQGEQIGLQMVQEQCTPALAGGIVFAYDYEGDAPPEASGKKHNHLF